MWFIPDLNVRVNLGDMQCCNGCCTCCGSNATTDVHFVKKAGSTTTNEHVSFKDKAVFVLEKKVNDLLLRQKKWCEGLCCGSKTLNQDTLEGFYDVQVANRSRYGAQITALFAAWKRIDFVQMHQTRAALTAAHIYLLYDAVYSTKKIHQCLEDVIWFIKECTKEVHAQDSKDDSEQVAKNDKPKGAGSKAAVEVSVTISDSQFSPFPYRVVTGDSRTKAATPTTVDQKMAMTRTPSSGSSRSDAETVGIVQFRHIAQRRGIELDLPAIQKIAKKFETLFSKDHGEAKPLKDLASTKALTVDVITYDEAVRLLVLANTLFSKKMEIEADLLRASKDIKILEILQALVSDDRPPSTNLPGDKVGRQIYVEAEGR